MAAADPPDPEHGPSKQFSKILLEENETEIGWDAGESERNAAPVFFDAPSAPSSRIVTSAAPPTVDSEFLAGRSYDRPELPHRVSGTQKSNLNVSAEAVTRSSNLANNTGAATTTGDSRTARTNHQLGSSLPVTKGSRKLNSNSPHLSAVPPIASIATKCCPDGHANNPDVRVCRICGVTFRPTTKIVQMSPDAIFRLIFDDGTAMDIADDIVVGRSPIDDSIVDTLTIEDPQVSRKHFALEAQGWQLTIRDCGSMNGTFLSRRGKRGRVRVSSETSIPVQAGDTVHFGSYQALIVDSGSA